MSERLGWTPIDELEYQVSFDMPLLFDKRPEAPKSPTPTKPIRPIRVPEVAKKHIKRDGKK